MSALPPKADMCGATRNVRFVPVADMQGVNRVRIFWAYRSRCRAIQVMGSGITRLLCHSHDWLMAAMNNHSPNLSGVGGGPAVSGLACGALATDSGDFALGGRLFCDF